MRTSSAGILAIHRWEACRLKAYQDVKGVWTIGWGHTSAAGTPVVKPGMVITQGQADAIFKKDLANFEKYVDEWVKVPLTQNQYDALVSFVYNVGPGNFKSSTLLRKLNAKDYAGAAAEFSRWNKSGGKYVQGLANRRQAEMQMFTRRDSVPSSPSPSTQATPPTYTLWDFIKRIFGL
jgi:lysozyme